MKKQNELALIIAFYISKYDREGIQNLGYKSFNDVYRDIERKLGVKSTSVKNRRDEFDPINANPRVRWYQRPMSPSRVRIVELFSSLSEPALRGIVKDIIEGRGEVTQTLEEISKSTSQKNIRKKRFILRGPTGKRAEELFVGHFNSGESPFSGNLEDCRELSTGYDFRIKSKDKVFYIEVKGLDGYTGGIVFTDKEWRTACEECEQYYVVVVTGISESPKFTYYRNPAKKFCPSRSISTVVTVSWNVSPKQITK